MDESTNSPRSFRGRGSADNPPNRFERLHVELDADETASEERPGPATLFYRDHSRSVIARNDSPDIGFEASLNPYRGCEHGCIYCYARPTHDYLGFSSGLDFESRIMVKEDAPELLREELASPKWKPQTIALGSVTDPYQPVERRLGLTRRCLEVLLQFRNPVVVVTKNRLVTRDSDLLAQLAAFEASAVFISLTTLDATLARTMEPRTATPEARLEAMRRLSEAGVPVGVMTAPIIPGLTDHEIPSLLRASAEAGARFAGYVPIRLPHGVAGLFENWLDRHYPAKKKRVLDRIRSLRGGKLNDPRFGHRMRGEGIFAEQISVLFQNSARRFGLDRTRIHLSTASFRRPEGDQLELFL